MSTLLGEFSELHVAPLEARLARRERTLGDIARLVASAGAGDGLAGRLSDLLRREGLLEGTGLAP